ncbi:hypothetical protein LSH36_185g00028 [Paralvinella palmiformis]|uniref:Carbohydrate sulfotransferase n=1 Tax=Paralvinella palmiformis TaxID=53620 RepID=A0AAD9JT49_9ANNE|nr:hypothetical protein LSH36_185g00028 [Paralvinella palmiformis]
MEHGNVFFTVTCFFPLIQYPMNLVKLVSLGEYLLNNDDQFYSNSDDVSTEYEAHLEQPHVVSGVQANGPPKHPSVEYSPIIREPVMEHSVHLPLQSDPVIAVHADAPRYGTFIKGIHGEETGCGGYLDLWNNISKKKCSSAPRLRELDKKCKTYGWSSGFDKDNAENYQLILVDEKHKVLYCAIPKVASGSFKTFILTAATGINDTHFHVHDRNRLRRVGVKYLTDYDPKDRETKISTYFKFIVVRHPFDRLVSAYKNKFLTPTPILKRYQKFIKMTFKENSTTDEAGRIKLTFDQFLYLIVKYYETSFKNEHWLSYYEHCHPCNIKYDYIIKLETIEHDLKMFYKNYFKSNERQDVIRRHNGRSNITDKLGEVTKFFSAIDPTIVKELLNIYKKDFVLFSYTWDSEGTGGCSQFNENGFECC